MKKLLSIIIPSYNMEHYLPKCLGSLIVDDPEMLRKLDVIVVNDGSRDRTSEIAHEFEKKYPDVARVIDKQNGHYGSCVNAALPIVRGKFVKILDADDWFDTSALAQYLQVLGKLGDNAPAVIFTDYKTVDPDGTVLRENVFPFTANCEFSINEVLSFAHKVYMHGVTYRTSVFEKLNYHQKEGICYTDTEWIFLPMASSCRFWYAKVSLYRYMLGRAGQSADIEVVNKSQEQYFQLIEDMSRIYDEHKDSVSDYGRKYMLIQLLRLGKLIYWMNIAQSRFATCNAIFETVDGRMKVLLAWLYQTLGEMDYCDKWFGKHHLGRMRQFGAARRFYLLYVKFLAKAYRSVGLDIGETPFLTLVNRLYDY